MSPPKKGKKWSDHYTDKAKKQGFPARSVFKLEEMQKRFQILRPGFRVLDLGCSPGSWLMFSAKITGPSGMVTGLDLKPLGTRLPEGAKAIVGDVFSPDFNEIDPENRKFHVVMSDMAPNTSGNKNLDSIRSSALSEAALFLSEKALLSGGTFVCKIFQGQGFDEFLKEVKARFKSTKLFKPQGSRKASREIYIIAKFFTPLKDD